MTIRSSCVPQPPRRSDICRRVRSRTALSSNSLAFRDRDHSMARPKLGDAGRPSPDLGGRKAFETKYFCDYEGCGGCSDNPRTKTALSITQL